MDSAAVAPAATVNLIPCAGRELWQGLIRLAAHGDIAIQFPQGCAWSGGWMRPNRDFYGVAPKLCEPLLRDAQLRRRATPEEIGGGGWNDQEVRTKGVELRFDLRDRQLVQMRVHQQGFVPGRGDLVRSEKKFQRIVRILATEIGRAFEGPRRIDQSKFHDAASGTGVSAGCATGSRGKSSLTRRCSLHHS